MTEKKRLYLVGGPMGVGKTTACQALKNSLPNAVFLDGDWCWDMHPFQVTAETRAMVMENICFLLNRFLACPAYEHVIFGWVMHEQAIVDEILSRLSLENCRVCAVSLVCDEQTLRKRLAADIAAGKRQQDVVERSLRRLAQYGALNTVKLDVSCLTAEETAARLRQLAQ